MKTFLVSLFKTEHRYQKPHKHCQQCGKALYQNRKRVDSYDVSGVELCDVCFTASKKLGDEMLAYWKKQKTMAPFDEKQVINMSQYKSGPVEVK